MTEPEQALMGPSPPLRARAPNLRRPESILDMVNYQMHRIAQLNGANVRRLCEGAFGITRTEWEFLSLLHAFGPTSPSDLSAYARLDKSVTSKTLKSLRDKKLVNRTSCAGDARKAMVELAEEGHALHVRLLPKVAELNDVLLSSLSVPQVESLGVMLGALAAKAQELVQSDLVEATASRRAGGSQRRWRQIAPRGG